jgi:hypothetical protein
MDEMIGYCGYNCHLCAARSEDPAIRQELVDGWRRIFGLKNYTAENVKCDGCPGNGRVADQVCKARPCAKEKGIESCARCEEFTCDKMRHLMSSRDEMLVRCRPEGTPISEEEYNLCMRQFDSIPNLVRILASEGKLGSWTVAGKGK